MINRYVMVFTDVLLSVWGGNYVWRVVGRTDSWPTSKSLQINLLKLLKVFLVLQDVTPLIQNRPVLVKTPYFYRQGLLQHTGNSWASWNMETKLTSCKLQGPVENPLRPTEDDRTSTSGGRIAVLDHMWSSDWIPIASWLRGNLIVHLW